MFRWLEWESAAEAEELAERRKLRTRKTAEQSGETLIDLAIEDHQTGLAGRHLFTFVKRSRTRDLPWNRLRIGSPVVVTPVGDNEEPAQNGVVSARTQHAIEVALEHWISGKLFDIDLSTDEVTRNRERAALARAREVRGRQLELRQILLGDLDPIWGHNRLPRFRGEPPPLVDVDHLNPSQCEAIQFALTAEDVAIIHGPPGTGKTTSVVAFIRQAISRGERVLACAPSNTAVDNLLERLVAAEERVVRLGHPARVKQELRNHTLDGLVEAHDNMRVARNLLRRAEQLYEKADRYTRARPVPGSKYEMRQEAKRLKHEARQLERRAIFDVLEEADVICCTNTIDEEVLGDREFDWVVIDEACQCTEPATWMPILRGQRVLLAGDHCQLPPTVRSIPAAEEGFARSMMQRLVETHRTAITRPLIVQYRMHEEIMQFSSEQFYGGTLEADDSVRRHVLADLPHVVSTPLTDRPVTFIDTAGADYDEELEPDGLSRRNPAEGRLVLAKARQLIDAGLLPTEIAVIAPYAAQVRWLRQNADHRALEIDTVDGFQGREKEAVIISLVRSNREGEIGFLGDTRRMNVALTRARRKLIVIGDSATLGHHPFYASMLDYFQTTDNYHTVWEEHV